MAWKTPTLLAGGKGMKFGMMACCAVMLVPLGAFLLAGGTLGGLTGNLGLLAPLALCLGAHFVMHRVMGKSCHDDEKKSISEAADNHAAIGRTIAPQ